MCLCVWYKIPCKIRHKTRHKSGQNKEVNDVRHLDLIFKRNPPFLESRRADRSGTSDDRVLYLLIFGHAFVGRAPSPAGVEYTAFLVPGLIMMSVLQMPLPMRRRP